MVTEPGGWISHFTTVSDSCQVSGNNPGKGIMKGLNCSAGRSKWFHLFHPNKNMEFLGELKNKSIFQYLRIVVGQSEEKLIWTFKSDLLPQMCARYGEKNSVLLMKPWELFSRALPGPGEHKMSDPSSFSSFPFQILPHGDLNLCVLSPSLLLLFSKGHLWILCWEKSLGDEQNLLRKC